MKKKLITILLACVLSANVTACSSGDSEIKDKSQSSESTNDKSSEKETKYQESESDSDENEIEKTLVDIENFMLENGVIFGEKTKMDASMIGGIDGFKYKDSNVEIYEYDTNSEEYVKLSNGEAIPLQGMESVTVSASAINGKFVLMGNPTQETIDVFNSFK